MKELFYFKRFNYSLILFFIIVIAVFLRFYQLGQNPPSVHADEADVGYTAYSILKTGYDPYGNFLPLQFEDQAKNFRAPLYTYSIIPSIMIFGLNPFAERLPSAFFGVLSVLTIFFLAKKLFNENVAVLSSLLFAINPWSIQISRTGLEVSLSLLLVLAGTALFLYASSEKKYLFLVSGILLGLSVFAYHSAKIFLPLFLPILLFYKWKSKRINIKEIGFFLGIFAIFYVVMLSLALFNQGAAEFRNVSIFENTTASRSVNRERHLSNAPLWLSSVFHNKPLYYLKQFENSYIRIFSPNYLFLNGESNLDKGVSNHGEFYLFELPFFLIGLYGLFKNQKLLFGFLAGWLLVGAVPAGITSTGYYTYRDVNMLPIPLLLSSFGVVYLFRFIKNALSQRLAFLVACSIAVFFIPYIASYFFTYFFDYPVYSRDWWQSNQALALDYAVRNKNSYDSVFINGGGDWPIIYAFYNKIDPRKFQNAYKNKINLNGSRFLKLGKFYFGEYFDQSKTAQDLFFRKNSLYILPGNSFEGLRPLYSITDPDGVHIDIKLFNTR